MHGSYKSRTNDPCRRLHPFQLGDPAAYACPARSLQVQTALTLTGS